MTSYTVRYEEVKARATRKGRCPTCGKRSVRTCTFTNTVNPFNTNPDGLPKTYAEVVRHVEQMAADWAPTPAEFEHNACEFARAEKALAR